MHAGAVNSAMLDRVKKIALSASVVVLFALYALQQKGHAPLGVTSAGGLVATRPPAAFEVPATVAPTVTRPTPTMPASAASDALAPTVTPPATAPPATAGRASASRSGTYRDGTYTGSLADANWGNVEVQVVISGGQIGDVQFLEYPNHRGRSREINAQAMPMLTQEAISSQRATVDIVTGATDTSEAFIQSLSAALQQATA